KCNNQGLLYWLSRPRNKHKWQKQYHGFFNGGYTGTRRIGCCGIWCTEKTTDYRCQYFGWKRNTSEPALCECSGSDASLCTRCEHHAGFWYARRRIPSKHSWTWYHWEL